MNESHAKLQPWSSSIIEKQKWMSSNKRPVHSLTLSADFLSPRLYCYSNNKQRYRVPAESCSTGSWSVWIPDHLTALRKSKFIQKHINETELSDGCLTVNFWTEAALPHETGRQISQLWKGSELCWFQWDKRMKKYFALMFENIHEFLITRCSIILEYESLPTLPSALLNN